MEISLVFLVCLMTMSSAQDETSADVVSTTHTAATTTTGPDCGNESYYGPTGVISSPNYPFTYELNLDCNYSIYTSGYGTYLSFYFTELNTETNFDVVTISCPTNSSFPPQSFSGSVLPDPFSIPWCSEGLVNFRSDHTLTFNGFSLDYYVSINVCGNTIYNGSHGYMTSPDHPNNYHGNYNCSSSIYAEQPSHFHISFLLLDIPPCGGCTCAWVEISCLDNNPSDKHRFCGSAETSLDINWCSQLLVWFYTDHSTPYYKGFNLEFNVFPESGTMTPTATSFVPTSTTDIFQSTQVPPDCGISSYYGPSGVIRSPNYPGNYSNYLSCDFYVNASSSSSSIAIIFQAFDTQQCCDYVTISCPTNSLYPSVKYSGSSLPQPLSIPWCSGAAVNFITDGSTISTGFYLDYHISLGGCGDTVYTGSHGYVSSPNYPSSYGVNQNCSNIIWSRFRSTFTITFDEIDLEECCDFVELSCLDNANSGSFRFTGSSIPPKLDIPGCTQVLVWFYADDTIVDNGFNLEYSASLDPEKNR